MRRDAGNAESVVGSLGVKLHLFEPSNRKIWTVVGKENEHWLDPDLGFCSCEDYYYNTMTTGKRCYHLKAVESAKTQNKVDVIKFSDSEFDKFLGAMIGDFI